MFSLLAKRLLYFKMNSISFSFKHYDCVGFDLDHTISLYQLDNVIQMQYQLLTNYLKENGYENVNFPLSITNSDIDFIQRGLFLDFKRGNLLKIGHDGTIICGTHGTKKLSKKELTTAYGKDQKWELTDKFVTDTMSTWKPPVSDNMRSMMEFFDCQVPLVFGKVIDFIDQQNGKCSEEYTVWLKILDGIIAMFEPNGGFYEALYHDPKLYLRKCSKQVIEWLDNLRKENKLLFLLTGSRENEALFLADYCLGKNWKRYFDLIIYNAKKPGFFSDNRPFLEQDAVSSGQIPFELTQGNWNELHSIISKRMSLENPKCVYIGDNLIQDIYATSLTSNIDAVALIEEISEEEFLIHKDFSKHPYADYLKSNFWGSYLFPSGGKTMTVWGSLMTKYSKLNIPSLDFLASKPVNHEFTLSMPDTINSFHLK